MTSRLSIRNARMVNEGDLVLVDMQKSQKVEREQALCKCGWSPLESDSLRLDFDR